MSVTVNELNEQAAIIKELRAQNAQLAAQKKPVAEALDLAETKMIELLKKADLKNYRSPSGLATITHRSSVKTPKTQEDWKLFLGYLKEHDPELYDSTVCVKSNDLNSYFKMKFEEAKANGADDFEIPGLDGITLTENLSFTQG